MILAYASPTPATISSVHRDNVGFIDICSSRQISEATAQIGNDPTVLAAQEQKDSLNCSALPFGITAKEDPE